MLGAEGRQDANRAGPVFLDEGSREHLERFGHSLVRPLLHSFDVLGQLVEPDRDGHLRRTTSGRQSRVEHDVARHSHSILQIPLDLVEDVLGWPSQEDRASLGGLALGKKGEVLVSDLLDLEQTALRANVRLLKILYTVYDGGSGRPGYPVVIRLAHPAQSRDIRLHQVMLRKI